MYGTTLGNILGTTYYLYFQLTGLALAFLLFRREKLLPRLLAGSVTGSLLAAWLPVLFSFFFDFTLMSHILALLAVLPAAFVFFLKAHTLISAGKRQALHDADSTAAKSDIRQCRMPRPFRPPGNILPKNPSLQNGNFKMHIPFLTALFLTLAFWAYLLYTHTLLPGSNGSLHTGQCTYGDMNMHLGFITSLAVQGTFPPDYSIMPGVRLSYPFLSDSVSSSLYLLGMSLRAAYVLPMFFAMAQIFTSVYLFALDLLPSPVSCGKETGKRRRALLTLFLFFCGGGLGFTYFVDWSKEAAYSFSDIFTGFYTTPANLIKQNIRWVNIIADMLLPQRATLFGYALLFPALWLLYRAVFQNRTEYFPAAALWVAALPMIHTHSFLSAAVISAVWLLLWLYREVRPAGIRLVRSPSGWIFAAFVLLMCLMQLLNNTFGLSPGSLLLTGISLFAAAALAGFVLLCSYIRKNGCKPLLAGWGIYLFIILVLALPQLCFWTFGQVAQGGFVRGHFNWGNQGDSYIWFYIKNLGTPLLLITGGICACDRKRTPLFLPALFLWWLGELIVFTPNTYDNNKLLYAAYFLLCLGAADYGTALYSKIKGIPGCRFFAAAFLLCSSLSGILTLTREALSDYQLYSPGQTALAAYVEENISPEAVFLTNTRHNNEIASLTGRNIVCGADTFLYFHGLDTTERKSDLRLMYEAPLEHMELFEKYRVDYVVISPFERSSYTVDEAAFLEHFEKVYSRDDILLFAISAQ